MNDGLKKKRKENDNKNDFLPYTCLHKLRKVKEREFEKGERKNACFVHTYPFQNADESQR